MLWRSLQAGHGIPFWRSDRLSGNTALTNPQSLHTCPLHFLFLVRWLVTWAWQGAELGSDGLVDRAAIVWNPPLFAELVFKALFPGQFVWLLVRHAKGPANVERTTPYAMLRFLAYMTFNNGVHENYWFTPCLLSLMSAFWHRVWRAPALVIAVAANLNLLLFHAIDGTELGEDRMVGIDPTVPLAVLVIMAYSCDSACSCASGSALLVDPPVGQ